MGRTEMLRERFMGTVSNSPFQELTTLKESPCSTETAPKQRQNLLHSPGTKKWARQDLGITLGHSQRGSRADSGSMLRDKAAPLSRQQTNVSSSDSAFPFIHWPVIHLVTGRSPTTFDANMIDCSFYKGLLY